MAEWIYKATEAKISFEETRQLAEEFHFLCRALYYRTSEGKLRRRPRTQHVDVDDIIHFYYKRREDPEPEAIGTFRIVQASRYPGQFGETVDDTALVTVESAALIALLKREHERRPEKGYKVDPKHGTFMGWVIERVDREPPPYPDELKGKRGRIVLAPYTATGAPEAPPSGTRWSRITFDPAVMGGKPCIRGMRVTVGTIVGLLAAGRSVPEILQAYPYLEEDDIRDALAYAAWRAQEQDLPLSVA